MRFLYASCVVLSFCALGLATRAQMNAQPLSMAPSDWSLEGQRTALASYQGRDVLDVETGFGYRHDVRLLDGTIDFDVELTRRRSFVYVTFRMVSNDEHEEFYLRPHKSSLPDALQYAPVWQGQSAWQLHHGPGGTAAVAFDAGAWTHVRVVMEGRHAALFVGDMARPALLVSRLARDPQPGYIGFGGLAVPETGQPIARFSNIVVQPGVVRFDFASALAGQGAAMAAPAAQAPAPAVVSPGSSALVIREWTVSKAFPPETQPLVPFLPDDERLVPFQRLTTEADGLLELHQYVTLPSTGRYTAAVARVRVDADRAGVRALDLGFSDVATVFLNGRPIFTRDDSYSFDRPRREGLIGYDQARVYLPLVQGANRIDVIVSDRFGGWGLMGRFVDATGLRLQR